MSPTKWLPIFTLMLAVVGYLAWMGDRKCEDPNRSQGNKRFLRVVRMVWGPVLVAIAIGLYNVLLQHEKAPRFLLFLNSLPLTNNTCITIPSTNDSLNLEFSVYNGGEADAEGLELWAYFPNALSVIPSGNWQGAGLVDTKTTGGLKHADVRGFTIPANAPALLTTNQILTFPPLTLQCSNLHNSVNTLILRATAKNVKESIFYTLHITNGVGKQYIGF